MRAQLPCLPALPCPQQRSTCLISQAVDGLHQRQRVHPSAVLPDVVQHHSAVAGIPCSMRVME